MSVIHRGEQLMPQVRLHFSHVATFIFLILISFVFFIGVHGFYFQNWHTGAARVAAKFLPIPAAIVEGDIIWYKQVSETANLLIAAEEESEGAFDMALEAVIRQVYVEHLAEELGVSVTRDEVSAYEVDMIDGFLEEVGWSEREYRNYVVKPLLLAQKTEEALLNSYDYQAIARDDLAKVLLDLELGIPFSDLAEQYSEDGSAVFGGDIGLFEKFKLPVGMEPVWDLEVDQVSEILDLGDSYALVKVYDNVVLEGERTHVALQVILVKKATLSEVLEDFARAQEVKVFVR
ncbi:hypothetical protein CO057_03155 [Candidatus Uhrbacteria bacterium CG_4_9_14_0_2_um_filter_41_50]|uniref:PpiC domain-containing protein n=1 Tax=Candidatus Uhrbacteria bacterium CG_4_9_14_0_2_um_filter_41_50 TaxID=1975031 RepID=A0A2M8ENS1_9BACT|nr:MAG: hypothetical protein COZ45_03715 [Candidatus Uhrbacteria bacterium CG_4_10_14_3_um_filter_41_21]PIZ54978.1 MAG: hypothetical protein COY24_02045 [Candidatus Uhrbacteria bacterium CG_4_10_14_0_2_um_filter_41_21]PJB84343.1 MAG: hypothetical protein CO086_04045 [Candidatus Uhrbacteria bacterium CG_4_9_14_0_8_um_filter_41_16]PJC24297.1 MAG: hypothetical protein CO057_03155 [Candidatus Uhrbacteria bacterium CG_4_9_14_0_2_um_filter_41_50]PJE75340.1 MAG: hypothetical protein COV03_01050 [Candi